MPDFTKYAFGAGIGGTAVVAFLVIRALFPKKIGPVGEEVVEVRQKPLVQDSIKVETRKITPDDSWHNPV